MASSHSVYIGDSSSLFEFESMKRRVAELRLTFKVFLYHIPELTAEQAIYYLASQVSEPYVAYCGDDDFLVPSAICSCIEILEVNLDARIAQGKSIIFEIKGDSEYGIIDSINDYINQTDLRYDTGSKRLSWFVEHYFTPQFSIHRTPEFKVDMKNMNELSDRNFTELISNFSNIINGKSYTIEQLYLIRQSHNGRNLLPSRLDWLLSPFWHHSCMVFVDTLAEHLAKIDSIAVNLAEKIIKDEFSKYLGRSLSKKLLMGHKKFLTKFLECFPSLRYVLKKQFYAIKYRTYGTVISEFIKFIENSKRKIGR